MGKQQEQINEENKKICVDNILVTFASTRIDQEQVSGETGNEGMNSNEGLDF